MPTAHQYDRVVWRRAVQIVSQREPLLRQLGFVPIAVRDDEVSGGGRLCACRDRRQDIRYRSCTREIDSWPSPGTVEMVVHQAGHHRVALEIDQASLRTCQRTHLLGVANRHHVIADDGDGFQFGECAIDHENVAVIENRVRRRRPRQRLAGRQMATAPARRIPIVARYFVTAASISAFARTSPSAFWHSWHPWHLVPRPYHLSSGRKFVPSSRYSDPMSRVDDPGIDDFAARLILTPLVGIAIPSVVGLVHYKFHSVPSLIGTYAWFVAIAYATWEGNLRLYLRFQDPKAWLTRPWHRVRLLVGLICLFTVPFTVSALWLWAALFHDPAATWRAIAVAVLAIVAAVIFITHVYETVFLVREWESDRVRYERLQREMVEAELLALTSEVNPHTLFNNLHALSHLVDEGNPAASAFVSALASSYRYLLKTRSQRVVPLADELVLLDQFIALVSIRYAGGLRVSVHVDADAAMRWLVPPVVLPELLENAVKHNAFSPDLPLHIDVRLEGDRLTVSHERRPRTGEVSSTGLGLDNLAQRFRLITGVAARWADSGGRFVVTLPLIAARFVVLSPWSLVRGLHILWPIVPSGPHRGHRPRTEAEDRGPRTRTEDQGPEDQGPRTKD